MEKMEFGAEDLMFCVLIAILLLPLFFWLEPRF
jgi:hypothetical protein